MPIFYPDTVIQTQHISLESDITIASTTFQTALSIDINTAGGNLIITFTGSTSNTGSTNQNRFRIQLDGATIQGGSVNTGDGGLVSTPGGAVAVVLSTRITNVSIGSHTITVQWACSGGTARIRPIAAPVEEFGHLRVEEVSV